MLQHPLVDPSFEAGRDLDGAKTALRAAAETEVVRMLLTDGRADPGVDESVA